MLLVNALCRCIRCTVLLMRVQCAHLLSASPELPNPSFDHAHREDTRPHRAYRHSLSLCFSAEADAEALLVPPHKRPQALGPEAHVQIILRPLAIALPAHVHRQNNEDKNKEHVPVGIDAKESPAPHAEDDEASPSKV